MGVGNEAEIIRRAAAGDSQAFAHLVDRYKYFLLAVILPIVRDHAAAEDVLQETFLQIYRSLPAYAGGSLKAWMARIATNKAIDWNRRASRQRWEEPVADWQDLDGARPLPSAEDEVLRRAGLAHLVEACAGLPPPYRQVFLRYYGAGKSYQELAAEAGVSVKTIESRLYRARRMLRKRLEEG